MTLNIVKMKNYRCSRPPRQLLIVSHDLEDAVFLADRILLLTRRPTRIAELVSFEMARPRLPEAVADPEFVRVKAHTLEVFRREMNA